MLFQEQVQQDWFSLKQAQMTRIIALGPTLGPTPCLPRPPGSLAHHQHDPSQGQVHPSPQYYHCPGLRTMPTPDPLIFSHCQPPPTPGCTVVLSEPTCDSSFCYILQPFLSVETFLPALPPFVEVILSRLCKWRLDYLRMQSRIPHLLGEQPASGPAPQKERLGDVAAVGSRPISPGLSLPCLGWCRHSKQCFVCSPVCLVSLGLCGKLPQLTLTFQ